MEKINCGGNKKNVIWKRTAVTGAILAAMAAPLIVMPSRANADLASAVESGSYGPVVTIVSPQYADVVKGNDVSITVAVQQRTNPVKALQMFVDDHIATPGWVPLKSLQSSKFNWDTTLFTNGPHKLTVRVADAAGLIGQAEITVYVNNAGQSQQQNAATPALTWLGVQNGQVLKGIVNLELQASGNFGVKYIFVMLNSASNPDQKPALRSWMINQPPYIIPFDTTKVNDGAYVLDALAYDALSNQGEAPRLNIGIANNTINPTYIAPSTTGDNSAPKTDTTKTPTTTDTSDTTNTTANPPAADTETNTGHSTNTTNTTVATTQTAPLVVPFQPAAPTLVPQPSRDGALQDNSEGNDTNTNNGPVVEVQTSLQVQHSDPAPRVTPLPMRMATNNVPAQTAPPAAVSNVLPKTTMAQPELFASSNQTTTALSSLNNEQPLTTMVDTKLSLLPDDAARPASTAKEPVLEAALPTQSAPVANNAMGNSLRQSPLSTIVDTHMPNSIPSQAFAASTPQRYFQVNDALSIPLNTAAVPVKTVTPVLPVFPQALLNQRSAQADIAPQKSTFTAPATGMTDVNVASRMAQATPGNHTATRLMVDAQIGDLPGNVVPQPTFANVPVPQKSTFTAPVAGMTNVNVASRMAQATPGNHTSTRLLADAQIGDLPGYAAPKPVSVPRHIVAGQPLFTAPDAPTMASSRIASAKVSGDSWGYQHPAQYETGHSTKPQIAFLPKFNAKPRNDALASITVSPVSTKMQVSETSGSWPAVYQARQAEKLSAIAQRYGLPVEVLAKNNNLKNAAVLTAGQKIKMPRNLQVTYNGKPMHSDVSSMLVGTTSVAAFRFLFEQQGGKVTWDSATQTVHAKNGNNEVTLTIGSNQAVVNQKDVMMDLAAFLLSGRTMVPVRLFEKSLNAQVTWDPSTGRMFVAMAG